jgi:hypothetical protein
MYIEFLVAEPLVRLKRRWEDNIKVELKKKGCEDSTVYFPDSKYTYIVNWAQKL